MRGRAFMTFDLVLAGARIGRRAGLVDIGIKHGQILAIEAELTSDAPREEACGCFVFGGFVDSHIHLDKACILDRCIICEGTLHEAVRESARAKAAFTVEDVYARAARVIEAAILHGTMALRTFVEIDPRAGFRSFEAIMAIKRDYAWAIDVQVCAFAQEGTTQEPQTLAMLAQALRHGADLIGGCPYTDPDPAAHIRDIFDLAEQHAVAIDFHLDFDLDPSGSNLPCVIAETRRRGYDGRVSIGHATKLSAMAPDDVRTIAGELAEAGIGVTVLPATDLFLLGRGHDRLVPRGIAPALLLSRAGVTTSAATNNILNPFTPFGDASLVRMANLLANTAHLSRDDDILAVFAMVSEAAGSLIGHPQGLDVGKAADIVLLDAADPVSVVREIRPAVAGWKRGRKTFSRPRPTLHRPEPL
ncbi:amidohydrolase [Labrys miyagiensis]|uniref:Amidohydrolase n=2 Tax=Labrys miyagiensis TaxID=346912 RepID=A0ABQ6CJ53_9HYPH|nr:amidohydrolase [Labrys miyagiensis]